jgi:hypothetical protein
MATLLDELLQWRSYHLFYRGNYDRVLTDFVRPVVAVLLRDREIESFFFIRYAVGGPHLRIRVLPGPRGTDTVDQRLSDTARDFLARYPSPEAGPGQDSKQRVSTASQELAADTFQRCPPEFELDRYGGSAYFVYSLSFFALSSVQALYFTDLYLARSWAQRLALFFRQLARQAWSFSCDQDEFLSLLYYFSDWGYTLGSIAERADQKFNEQQESLCSLLCAELDQLDQTSVFWTDPKLALLNTAGGQRLSWEIRSAGSSARSSILMSQMHMTANRLGLRNVDEMYVSRLLYRAAEEIRKSHRKTWRHVERTLTRHAHSAAKIDTLQAQLESAFNGLASSLLVG